jgi:hypothetical protein
MGNAVWELACGGSGYFFDWACEHEAFRTSAEKNSKLAGRLVHFISMAFSTINEKNGAKVFRSC